MKLQFALASALVVAAASLPALAQESSPAGLWKSYDEQTGRPKSLVRISESKGEYQGRIEKLFRDAQEDQNPKCVECQGEKKDQPIVGMTILSGMKKEETDTYGGGQILDPANGKTYRSNMTLQDGGKSLKVRGYIGAPLFGRSQTWSRVE